MAKKGKRGSSSAARSAAAKKGWETRRRGGAKAKPAATKRTAASKPKPTAKRGGMPKTTSARGRALTNQRRAADLVRASRGGKGPSAKAVRSVLTAQRARAFYAATGGGKKRSAVKAAGKKAGAAKVAAVRSRLGGGGSARPKAAGRPRSRVVAKPAAQRPAAKPRKVDLSTAAFERRAKATERRARKAEKELAQVDRFNPANKRIRNRAYALRSAADSYSSLVRRGAKGEFSAGYLFLSGSRASRRTTAPKLSRSEKAAITRAANAAKKTAANIRRMEQARRYG